MRKEINILVLVLVILLINISLVSAQNITFSLDQTDYYFSVGENAVINLDTISNYENTINGILSYTITQSVNQGNLQYSSSNTKSTSFAVQKGNNQVAIDFGTSDSPIMLNINLEFSYTDNESKIVDLNDIKIYFVDNETDKNNQQNKVSSSSQTQSETVQQQNDPFAQQQQQMQQMLNQMNSNQQTQQQPQQQSTEQKLQNNQLSQDSSALKQQMQNQFQEQQQTKNEFQKELAKNPEFQKEHQDLLNQGYNLTNANLNPQNNNTGDFELNYQKPNGEQASLSGDMNNGEMQSIQKDTPEDRQKMLDQLEQNEQFQKFQKQLDDNGFEKNSTDFSREENNTNIKLSYSNKNNETATINAVFSNNTVQNITINKEDKENESKSYWWILIIVVLFIAYFVYKKIFRKKKIMKKNNKSVKTEKPFDFKRESKKLLEKSKEKFAKKEYKDAYGIAGQALRLYLSYKNNLNKEITNDEIIDYLEKNNEEYKDAKKCFDICSLVEFAKYSANKKDFEKIIEYCEQIMEN